MAFPTSWAQATSTTSMVPSSTSTSTITRWAAVAIWLYAGGFAEIVKRWQAGS